MDPRKEFMRLLWRYKKGSISRREFLELTGLGLATAVLSTGTSRFAYAGNIGDKVSLATWPSYHDENNFAKFKKLTGAAVEVSVFGSNEEMYAKLKAGGTGWDLFVPTNYTIINYVKEGMIEALDLAKIPSFDASKHDPRFTSEGTIDGVVYAVPKDWGTTGYVYNTSQIKDEMTTWKQFWDLSMTTLSGRAMVHDYQLTTIGNALKYYGYSFNSNDEKELAQAEKLLLAAKPHLFGINSDYKPSLLNGDAWLSVCWTGDALQLYRENKAFKYVLGREGGEIWTDYFAIPKGASNREGGYALLNFLQDPAVNADEVKFHGYPSTDSRVNALLPKELLKERPPPRRCW